jgi:hypothetical protein
MLCVVCPFWVVDTSQVKLETYRVAGRKQVAFHHLSRKGATVRRSIFYLGPMKVGLGLLSKVYFQRSTSVIHLQVRNSGGDGVKHETMD